MDVPDEASRSDDTPESQFGAELRRLRVQAGLSIRGLAGALHRAHSGIVDYERGRRLPGADVVEQYESYFGLSPGTLGAPRERVRVQRLDSPRDATVAERIGAVSCPYKGLHAFEREDTALFFGRERQVELVLSRLAEVRFVAVVGASGSGKSSFVRAGLLAGLSAPPDGSAATRVALLTPSRRPLDELAIAIATATGDAGRVRAQDLRDDPGELERAARQAGSGRLVIVVDQFEELFTMCSDESERRSFVDALMAAWCDPMSPVAVIVALRADFYGRVADYPQLADAVVAHQTMIGPMHAADLRRVIEAPALASGLILQPGLVDTMLDDLADAPGALPLLSHALLETWKRRRRLLLTVGGYREAGGVGGAIAQTAERTLQKLPEADRAVARAILLRLTNIDEAAEPTRRRVDRAELAAGSQSGGASERVLGILACARLVTIDERTVVVAHEALIRHWPRLRSWIESDRAGLLIHRRLTIAASEWDALDREPAALYRGARLAAAGELAAAHHEELSGLERDFLTASEAAEHSERQATKRASRRLRLLAGGAATLAAVVAMLAVWALDQRADARQQATEATSLALSSAAAPLARTRPEIGLLLALEATRTSPRFEARSGALAALIAARDPRVLAIMHGPADAIGPLVYGPDGHTVASLGADAKIRLWDARRHRQIGAPLAALRSAPVGWAMRADGRTLALATADGMIRVWNVRTRTPAGAPFIVGGGKLTAAAFSPDGRTLASAGADGTVRLWDMRTHKQSGAPLTRNTRAIYGLAFSPDGRTLAAAARRSIRLWDTRTHRTRGTLPTAGYFSDLTFSPDGRTLASTGDGPRLWDLPSRSQLPGPGIRATGASTVAFGDGGRVLAYADVHKRIRLWNVRAARHVSTPLVGHTDQIFGLAFSPDGDLLASAGADKTIRLWDVRPGNHANSPLIGQAGQLVGLEFAPDGRTLASAGIDQTVRLWDLSTGKQRGSPLTTGTRADRTGPGPKTHLLDLAFSPDSRILATSGTDRTVRLWDVGTHEQLGATMTGHRGQVRSVAFAPDGRTLASGSTDQTVRVWDALTHQQVGAALRHTDDVNAVAFSPDGRTLAAAGDDRVVRLWDVRTHRQRGAALRGDTAAVTSMSFNEDGRTIASGYEDGTVRLWDVRSHAQISPVMTGHADEVRSVAFSSAGPTLVSADFGNVHLWDLRSHKQMGPSLPTKGSVAVSSDGRTLAAAGGSALSSWIQVWENILWRDVDQLQAEVCKLVGPGLSRDEWAQYASGISYRRRCP